MARMRAIAGCVGAAVLAAVSTPLSAARVTTPPLTAGSVTTITDGIAPRAGSVPSTVHIASIRLEAPPSDVLQPAAVLKFDMLNDGDRSITDILLEIAIREKLSDDGSVAARMLVSPFRVAGHATIEAGYAVNYQMLLRNLSSDCQCVADVRVVSAREVADFEITR